MLLFYIGRRFFRICFEWIFYRVLTEKLAARTKFEVKCHFTIRAGRIVGTRRIKFAFFPCQYLQNFSVSDQNPGVAATIKHIAEQQQKIFHRRSSVMDYNQIDGSVRNNKVAIQKYYKLFCIRVSSVERIDIRFLLMKRSYALNITN